eukprot:127619-Rhodomonas_salina.3
MLRLIQPEFASAVSCPQAGRLSIPPCNGGDHDDDREKSRCSALDSDACTLRLVVSDPAGGQTNSESQATQEANSEPA